MLVNNVQNAFLYWLAAYWGVTILGVLLTVIFAMTLHPPAAKELGVKPSQAPAYLKTVPYHLPMNVPAWLLLDRTLTHSLGANSTLATNLG